MTPKNENKNQIPFEYQKEGSASGKRNKGSLTQRTSGRSNDASPKSRFLSPTMSSKYKQGNGKKKVKAKERQVYTVEDLESNSNKPPKHDLKVTKRLNMDNIETEDRHMTTGYRAFEYEQDEEIQKLIEQQEDDSNLDELQEELPVRQESEPIKVEEYKSTSEIGKKFDDEFDTYQHKKDKSRYSTELNEEHYLVHNEHGLPKKTTPSKKGQKDSSKHYSPGKEESSKGHQEIISLLSNPNMLFNDASSIKYSIDNQNMSNFSIPSLTGDIMRPSFDGLDGMCYDLISAFVGDKFPVFIFANKKICTVFLDFQVEINEEVLNALSERINQSISYSLQSLSLVDTSNAKNTPKKKKKKPTTFSLSDG